MSNVKTIRTIRMRERPNLIWVEVETTDGLVGLGESFRGAEAVEGAVHDLFAPALLGQDSERIEYFNRLFTNQVLGFNASSAEMRGASAIDIALHDIKGKRLGVPVYDLLGGLIHTDLPVYNTCAGYSYNSSAAKRRTVLGDEEMNGPYDDQIAFMKDAGELAKSLLDEGYPAMKIWPFDVFVTAPASHHISPRDLKAGLEPFAKIRRAVGDSMDVMCELHSFWGGTAAQRICRALEDYGVYWAEDALCKNDDAHALAELRSRTKTPICASETVAGLKTYRDLLAADAVDFIMVDVIWCGGLTMGKKIATLAEAYGKPLSPHDCTGPIALVAGVHLALSSPTTIFQEAVRAHLTWYKEILTNLPDIRDGRVYPSRLPGLGTELRPEMKTRSDILIRESTV